MGIFKITITADSLNFLNLADHQIAGYLKNQVQLVFSGILLIWPKTYNSNGIADPGRNGQIWAFLVKSDKFDQEGHFLSRFSAFIFFFIFKFFFLGAAKNGEI